jgi:bifunctional oligoribonuclease and PAP phosphatase NrnA
MSFSKKSKMTWDNLKNCVERHESFCISSHLSLDGDCVGSQIAFYWYLRHLLGKKAVVYNKDPLPAKFSFLRDSGCITTVGPAAPYDVLVVLDCSNPSRLGWDTSGRNGLPVINIDHHRDNTNFGTINIVDGKASATGQILYRFFTENNIDFPAPVADALYAAILTDTGGFRFPNTNATVLRICADLAKRGADPSSIYENIYASHSLPGLMLHARIWSTLRYHCNGRVSTMELPYSLVPELGAVSSDSEGMADCTIMAGDVEVGMLIKHNEKESHFSLRSKGRIDVGKIAQKIRGGGGHSSAAGCTIELPFKPALEQMLGIIQGALDQAHANGPAQ